MINETDHFFLELNNLEGILTKVQLNALQTSYLEGVDGAYRNGWRQSKESRGQKSAEEESEPTNKELVRQIQVLMQIMYTLSRKIEKTINGMPADEYVRSSLVKYKMFGNIRGLREDK
jgi:hypothetical protein